MTPEKPSLSPRIFKFARTGLIYLLILVVAGFAGNLWMSRNQASGAAPPIVAQDLQGNYTALAFDEFDSPVLVYFFADWCPICKVQHSAIATVAGFYPVQAIAMQSGDLANVRAYVQSAGLEFPVLNDADGRVSSQYRVYGVPASFIIDNRGQIRFSTQGYATSAGLLIRLWLAQTDLL